ncbi:hypothetical protein V8E55_007449 [Tylopilus felleus]
MSTTSRTSTAEDPLVEIQPANPTFWSYLSSLEEQQMQLEQLTDYGTYPLYQDETSYDVEILQPQPEAIQVAAIPCSTLSDIFSVLNSCLQSEWRSSYVFSPISQHKHHTFTNLTVANLCKDQNSAINQICIQWKISDSTINAIWHLFETMVNEFNFDHTQLQNEVASTLKGLLEDYSNLQVAITAKCFKNELFTTIFCGLHPIGGPFLTPTEIKVNQLRNEWIHSTLDWSTRQSKIWWSCGNVNVIVNDPEVLAIVDSLLESIANARKTM